MKKIKSTSEKRKKKFVKDQNNICYPTKHDRIGNLNFYSEEIAKSMVDKIISLTFTLLYKKEFAKKLSNFYIEDFFKSINNLLELCNINHDIDDKKLKGKLPKHMTQTYVEKIDIDEKEINFKGKITDNNLINESMENLLNDNNDINKPNKPQYSINMNKKNFWGIINQPKNINVDRTCNNRNILKKNKSRKTNDAIIEEKLMKKISNINKRYSTFLYKKLTQNKEDNLPIKRGLSIYDFPSENIPKEEFERQSETEEIKQIRKEFLEEKVKINKEKEEKQKKLEKSQLNAIIEKNEKILKIPFQKAKIKLIKKINPDMLIKEFNPVFSTQKDVTSIPPENNLYQEISHLENEAKKNIEYNNTKTEVKKEIKKDMKKKIMSKISPKENKQNDMSLRLKPSGSNFGLINPSIGVKIKEESNVKSGGINFYQKFKKFSIYDFNNTLQISKNIEYKKLIKKQNDKFNNTSFFIDKKETKDIKIDKINEEDKNENENDDIISRKINSRVIYDEKVRKIFYNKLNSIHMKENLLKSKSGISLINYNYRKNKSLVDFLTSRETREKDKDLNSQNLSNFNLDYNNEYNNNYLDIINSNNENKNVGKLTDREKYSPIPTKIMKNYNNSFFKRNNKIYKIMDNFNNKIVNGEYKDIIYENEFKNNRGGIILPKINLKKNKYNSETHSQTANRTKNYFYRERKKKLIDSEDITKLNSNIL